MKIVEKASTVMVSPTSIRLTGPGGGPLIFRVTNAAGLEWEYVVWETVSGRLRRIVAVHQLYPDTVSRISLYEPGVVFVSEEQKGYWDFSGVTLGAVLTIPYVAVAPAGNDSEVAIYIWLDGPGTVDLAVSVEAS